MLKLLFPVFTIAIIFSGTSLLHAQDRAIIDSIEIDRLNIFDTTGVNWIERLANKLHRVTQDQIVRRELLFKEGDTLDQELVDETARNLRGLGFLATADVRENRVNDSLVDLDVVTRDRWSLYAAPWITNDGGITSASLWVGQSNFRGMGQSLNMSGNYLTSRKKPWGGEIDFNEPRTFGSEISTWVGYANSEDLIQTAVSVVKPFHTEEENWSAGIFANVGRVKAVQYENGSLSVVQFFNFNSESIWGIYSINSGDDKVRLGAAFRRNRFGKDSLFNSISQRTTLLNFSLGWLTRRFVTESYFDDLGRIEDVTLGLSSSAVLGRDIEIPGLYYFVFQNEFSEKLFDSYLSGSAGIQGYDENSDLKEVTLSIGFTGAAKTSPTSSIVASVNCVYGLNWSNGGQMFLDSPNRLRGIPAFAFTGNRRITGNLEHRFENDLRWKFFTIGNVIFADGGMIWGQGENYAETHFYKSFGYGLRIQNERLLGGTIIRLDFAYNVDMKNFEFIISTNQLFSAFGGVDTASP